MEDPTDTRAQRAPRPARGPAIGLGASIIAHVILALLLWVGVDHDATPAGDDPFARDVDVELAPAAPQAEILPIEDLSIIASELITMPAPATPPPPEVTPVPPPEPDGFLPDAGVPDARIAPDAGVEPADAGNAVAATEDERHRDGGVADGGTAIATNDEQGDAAKDPGVPSERFRDGVAEGAAGDAGVGTSDGGIGIGEESGPTEPASAGTAANLLAYFPKNHLVTVLVRFDRLRGTEWAQYAERVLATMPDHETLVGGSKARISEKLDLIAVSTPKPNDVPSTVLAMKAAISPAALRDLLDEPGAPVTWSRVTGGVLGTRGKGARTYPGDPRVFLAPQGAWMVLARPRDLPGLTTAAAGELDDAAADPAILPPWVQRLPELLKESGEPDGPVIMMTMAPRQKAWSVPDIGLGITEVTAPERITLSLLLDPQGFVIKGNLSFADAAQAEQFVTLLEGARTTALDTAVYKIPLKRARAYNAVVGLTLTRTGRRVAYATSVSIADGRALLEAGADLVAAYFEAKTEEAAAAEAARERASAEKPPPPKDPAPAEGAPAPADQPRK